MKKLHFLFLFIFCSTIASAQENWTQDGNTLRGRFFYNSSGALAYSVRTQAGGGWSWQLIDGSNNPYFHVDYPSGKVGMGTTTPVAKLHIVSQAPGTAGLHIQGLSGDSWISYWDGKNYFRGTTIFADNGGSVGIGTTNPGSFKLAVEGKIWAKEVQVALTNPGPDYVFEPTYKLMSLEETKAYIEKHKHLPEVPSAKDMETNGVQLGEMNMLLLKKVEELTLHIIALKKENEEIKKDMGQLKMANEKK